MKKLLFFILIFFTTHSLFGFEQSEILTVDEAFKVEATQDNKKVTVNIKLGDQIYLYHDKLKFTVTKPKELLINEFIKIPKAVKYKDDMAIKDSEFDVIIPLSLIKEKIGDGPFTLRVNYQGCSEKGLCYQPLKKSFNFNTSKAKTVSWKNESESEKKAVVDSTEKETDTDRAENLSEEDQIVQTLKSSSFFTIVAIFFGFGLLLSLTPCIYPMIPILSSIITSESKNSNKEMSGKRGFLLSLVYVLSMSVAYAIAGIIAGIFGANLQTAMQNPWIISIFALIFVALAFSMFGYYELKIPEKLQSWINRVSDRAKGDGGIAGVAIMGFLSALIVGPCVAPALAGAITYIGQTGDAILGGIALFVMSIGMGIPLLAIGAGAGTFMPKPGGWMTTVSQIFGAIMIAIAIWLLSRVIPGGVTLFLWGLFFISCGIYMGAFDKSIEGTKKIMKMIKAFAITSIIVGTIMFIGAFSGASDPLKPFVKFTDNRVSASVIGSKNISFKKVKTLKELEIEVQNSDKPVMIDFWAKWCVACKELEEITFTDPSVREYMSRFKLLKVDVTDGTDDDKEILKRFAIIGPPTIIFFDKDANELKDSKIIGFKPPLEFIKTLKSVLGE